MIEKALENIAEKILAYDEASLTGLWEKYKEKMESFDTTKEWEKAVIIFFIINAVRVKNQMFNEQVTRKSRKQTDVTHATLSKDKPYLKRVK